MIGDGNMYDRDLILGKFNRWSNYLHKHRLPDWEQLPDFGLYMDQVITLLSQYLSFLPQSSEEQVVTTSAINNYVRTGIMPPPNKKKYDRIHIAYLIMICSLKQSLNIADIQRIIPCGLSEDEMRCSYTDFVRQYTDSVNYFVGIVEGAADLFYDDRKGESVDTATQNLVLLTAVMSNFSKLLTTKLLALQNCPYTDEAVAEKE